MHHAEFNDPRLVAVYDAECPWSQDDDFFVSVANETPAARVLDLGCGTGRLALGLAAAGHTVTGVDPARASLDAANAKPGAQHVTWIEGTSAVLGDREFDVAVMTSHVAQVFVTDEEWAQTLADLRRVLAPDGRVVEEWTVVTAVENDTVSFTIHYGFPDHEELISTATLRFRSEGPLRASLEHAGFTVAQIYGGWNREPIGRGDGEFLVIARA